jgi:hypothetical protein
VAAPAVFAVAALCYVRNLVAQDNGCAVVSLVSALGIDYKVREVGEMGQERQTSTPSGHWPI